MDGFIIIIGLLLTFFPFFLFIRYILNKSKTKTSFDEHIQLVKDKKGTYGVIIAYLEQILFGLLFIVMGIWMSDLFMHEFLFVILIFIVLFYIIIKYLDNINEK